MGAGVPLPRILSLMTLERGCCECAVADECGAPDRSDNGMFASFDDLGNGYSKGCVWVGVVKGVPTNWSEGE